MLSELEAAWKLREKLDVFSKSEAVRIFHGPGEGTGPLADISIDRFGDHYWITEWTKCSELEKIGKFLEAHGARSAVHLFRPAKGLPQNPIVLFGEPPKKKFPVREGDISYLIQLTGTKHPGLFLDHAPLREWLKENSRGLTVLNTFAYTGSLSVAAGVGGAKKVTTLDLSKPTLEWARENWDLNRLSAKSADFIFGDYFEWIPRLAKKAQLFDCVILDPPSFSRGKKGGFSTAKDLIKLHELAFEVLAPGGILITSINSANISRKKYYWEVHTAAKTGKREIKILHEIELPQTFPTRTASEETRYLKGWILKSG
jgi:23S rRNA (cytosine1962-C5)-methyltransferase